MIYQHAYIALLRTVPFKQFCWLPDERYFPAQYGIFFQNVITEPQKSVTSIIYAGVLPK